MKFLLDVNGWNSILNLFNQQYLNPNDSTVEHKVDLKTKNPAGCNALLFFFSNYKGGHATRHATRLIDHLDIVCYR